MAGAFREVDDRIFILVSGERQSLPGEAIKAKGHVLKC
jgi:hypothetical protein